MSTVYQPPSVDDLPGGDQTIETYQRWLGSDPTDGLMRGMDAVPPPATSPAFSHGADENVGTKGRHMPTGDTSTRSRPRSATVRKTASHPIPEPNSSTRNPISETGPNMSDETANVDPESSSDETIVPPETNDDKDEHEDEGTRDHPNSPSISSTSTNFTSLTGRTHGSGSSSGSGSTITQASWPRRRGSEKTRALDRPHFKGRRESRSPQTQHLSGVLNYLEPDSPHVTAEAIQRSVEQSSYWRMADVASFQSPSTRSTSSTTSSSFQSDDFSEMAGDHETDRSSSPDHSAFGDSPMSAKFEAQMAAQQQRGYRNYGTPEMPRGNANLPHLPPNTLQPRLPVLHQGHPKHLPRAEKLPLTGYELIASKLCVVEGDKTSIKPMYRRFEALNHRLLLHLQDELAELEEQLHRLDTADTQTRRMQNCFLPASRRQEALAAGELQWHKTDILGKVGFKLSQYNHVLSSFKDTQNLPSPDPRDVDHYRDYLATHNPIADIEARFLDPVDDLVSLARPSPTSPCEPGFSNYLRAPQPRKASPTGKDSRMKGVRDIMLSALTGFLPAVAIAFAAAFLLPILTFAVIPAFIGRMAVVLLVAVGVAVGVVQAGLFSSGGHRSAKVAAIEGLLASGVYVGVMAVVAGLFGRGSLAA
ncbi:hypothetical protein CCHL11_07234 [Colletotrichum chlorophyti]|uniref:DUF6594 domain-containing protein n=1 Tax=Colletotrichum chlorophyti TaxID=708187 RepID=A0A1Q8RXD4_9PEZI|nr:hypothetical protein CCHL11_07234 [Colletotrichum chlorophyti]